MVKGRVSILIPSRGERFLPQTLTDLLTNATGDIEIYAVLDGYWPNPPLVDDPRLHVLHWGEARGMRPAINAAVALCQGQYLMKIDGHCMVARGFDEVLKASCDDNWVAVPRRYSLEPETWTIKDTGKAAVDAHFLSYPFEEQRAGAGLHGQVWVERAKARLDVPVDDEMSSQGSCWFMTRAHWDRVIGPMDTALYGNFIQEFQELGNKTWLTGGRVVCNKHTWYAHLHKGKTYGRGYFISKAELSDGGKACVDWWMNDRWVKQVHSMRWLIEKFWPIPSWPTTATGTVDWDLVMRDTREFSRKYAAGEPTHI